MRLVVGQTRAQGHEGAISSESAISNLKRERSIMKLFHRGHRHAEPQSGTVAVWSDFCAVAPSPELKVKLKDELSRLRDDPNAGVARSFAFARAPRRLGFDD